MKRVLGFLAIPLLASLVACGGGSDGVTSPSAASQVPNVAGTYSGQLSETLSGLRTGTYLARFTVVQAGSEVTISGTMTANGQTVQTIPVSGTVSATGNFTATSNLSGTASCGTWKVNSFSLAFAGNNAQYLETGVACGISYQYSGTLTK